MFKVGDLIIYSMHGVCCIDDICERTFGNVKKNYYVLHPIEDDRLTINVPVDSDKLAMVNIITKEEAEEVLEAFKEPGVDWIDVDNTRNNVYSGIVKKGNRKEIIGVCSTLLKVKNKVGDKEKKLTAKDKELLDNIQRILYEELSIVLDTTYNDINKRVNAMIKLG